MLAQARFNEESSDEIKPSSNSDWESSEEESEEEID